MFLTSSEFAPIVVLPVSSVVGSPVLKLVLGSVFAGAGQARSIPVPPLFAVAVESGPTGVGDAAGGAAPIGDSPGVGLFGSVDSGPKRTQPQIGAGAQ